MPTAPRIPLGLAIYTVRMEARRDFVATAAAIAGMGYREVDMYVTDARMPADAARRALDAAGLACPSVRVPLTSLYRAWDRALDDAAVLGARMVTLANVAAEERTTPRDWDELVALFARRGAEARVRGLAFCYHNHAFEFERLADGRVPFDLMVASTDASTLRLQVDVYWMSIGGRDPVREIARLGERVASLHLKDAAATPERGITTVGQGTLDFGAILRAADAAGVRHAFVEEDDPRSPMDAARAAARHLASLEP